MGIGHTWSIPLQPTKNNRGFYRMIDEKEDPDIIDNIDELSGNYQACIELLANHIFHIEKRLEQMGHKIQ